MVWLLLWACGEAMSLGGPTQRAKPLTLEIMRMGLGYHHHLKVYTPSELWNCPWTPPPLKVPPVPRSTSLGAKVLIHR